MSDPDTSPRMSTPYLLGEISAKLGAIDAAINRTVFRIDDLEKRTERLEVDSTRSGLWSSFVEKAVWGILGAVGVLALKLAGIV